MSARVKGGRGMLFVASVEPFLDRMTAVLLTMLSLNLVMDWS